MPLDHVSVAKKCCPQVVVWLAMQRMSTLGTTITRHDVLIEGGGAVTLTSEKHRMRCYVIACRACRSDGSRGARAGQGAHYSPIHSSIEMPAECEVSQLLSWYLIRSTYKHRVTHTSNIPSQFTPPIQQVQSQDAAAASHMTSGTLQ